jgi:N-acetylglucosaminylphosphatidylinositol deacetylase
MTKTWSSSSIADVLSSAFAPLVPPPPTQPAQKAPSKSKSKKTELLPPAFPEEDGPPRCTIDVLITFDSHGISQHPNHISLYQGAKAFLTRIMKGKSGYSSPLDLYTLHTTHIMRKYISAFDAPISMLLGAIAGSGLNEMKGRGAGSKGNGPGRLLFVNGIADYVRGVKAMTEGHRSQMRWFRWGWVGVGRYMVVNDLRRERVTA